MFSKRSRQSNHLLSHILTPIFRLFYRPRLVNCRIFNLPFFIVELALSLLYANAFHDCNRKWKALHLMRISINERFLDCDSGKSTEGESSILIRMDVEFTECELEHLKEPHYCKVFSSCLSFLFSSLDVIMFLTRKERENDSLPCIHVISLALDMLCFRTSVCKRGLIKKCIGKRDIHVRFRDFTFSLL